MTNHANDAARYINERIAEPETEPTVTDLRDRFPRRPMVKHPDRSNVWVREVSDRDHSLLPGSGREELDCA